MNFHSDGDQIISHVGYSRSLLDNGTMGGTVREKLGKGAISLTFDGGYHEHLVDAVEWLDARDLKATFFLTPTRLLDAPGEWRQRKEDGHELANHSLYGFTEQGALFTWTRQMVADDIELTQSLFRELFEFEPASFALSGWSSHCADGSYLPEVAERFPIIRTDRKALNDLKTLDSQSLASYPIDIEPRELRAILGELERRNQWLILRVEILRPGWKEQLAIVLESTDLPILTISQVVDQINTQAHAAKLV